MILLEFEPGKTAVRNKLAMVLLRKKKYVEAEKELRTVLATEPANYDALDGLGLVMTRTGRVAEAVGQFQAAIKANPRDVMAHYHLGQAHATLGDPEAARKAFGQALDMASTPGTPPTPAADLETIRQALAQLAPQSSSPPPAQ
jgi:Flp pilus assembly protein TadD